MAPIPVAAVVAAAQAAAQDTLAETAAALEAEAKKQLDLLVYSTPERGYRRTGHLINSVGHRVLAPGVAEVVATAEYARLVHDGTRHMSPRPFLTNAARIDRPRVAQRMARNLARRMK